MLVRLAATIDTIDPPCETGRPRDWSTVTMLGALWHLARDGCVSRRLPVGPACRRTRACGAGSRGGGCGRCSTGRSPSWSPAAASPRGGSGGRRRRSSTRRASRPARNAGRGAATPRQEGQGPQAGADGRRRGRSARHPGRPGRRARAPGALRALEPDLAAHPSTAAGLARPRLRGRRARGAFLNGHAIARRGRRDQEPRGLPQIEKRRWKVEQTFGCLQRYRRLRVDDEAGTDTSRRMTVLASLFMTGMRFERMLQA